MSRPPAARRLYLDHAATSIPNPPRVYEAMMRYGTEVGGTAGRGTYLEAREGGRLIRQCRDRINELINGEDPDHVIFTLNTTDALNLAIKGVVRHRLLAETTRPVHLIATDLDHNSVLRPFNTLAEETAAKGEGKGVRWTCVKADAETGLLNPADIAAAISPDTLLVAVNQVSNVTGAIQPAAEIGDVCRRRGVFMLLDAAQSVGHVEVDVRALKADLVALPGHKGLLGPLGTGGLYIRPGLEKALRTQREGGTGSRSETDRQPDMLPDKYEAGSQNAVGIVGLSEGVKFLLDRGAEAMEAHERELRAAMIAGLDELGAIGPGAGKDGLKLLGPQGAQGRTGVFSMIHETLSPQELAAIMEQEHGILGRAGLACAPRLHSAMGTAAIGGAYRLSIGPFTTIEDIRRTCTALSAVCKAATA
jgi:cysteine desulfurase / selenocysteine lyase